MILIISDINDKHADQVESILQINSASYSRLNLDVDSLLSTLIKYEEDTLQIEGPNCRFSTDEIEAVWNRSSRIEHFDKNNWRLYEDYQNWKEKCNRTLEGLFSSLKSTKWLNFNTEFYNDNHFRQFTISKNIGLKWPSYICTNDINYLNSFFENKRGKVLLLMNQDCSRKVVGECFSKCGDKFGSALSSEVSDNSCLVSGAAYQVRCTIVGKEYFVGKIKPNSNNEVTRPELLQSDSTIIQPPDSIKRRAIEIMTELNLTHGIFDFIVTNDEEWFFDALNPIGPYQWTEDIEGPDISLSIAKWLMKNN
jgi:hypothetical protein